MILLICGIKKMIYVNIQMILIYNTETDSQTEFMISSRGGWRGKIFREFGIGMYTHCCFLNIYFLTCSFIFGCIVSSLLHVCFLYLWEAGAALAFRCVGFSFQWLCLLQSMGSRAQGFDRCSTRAPECRLSSCDAQP